MIEVICAAVAALVAAAAYQQQEAQAAYLNITRRPHDPNRPVRCAYCATLRAPKENCPNCGAGENAWRHREANQ